MDKEKLTYIEETGLLFEISGLTRMAGRIFGYLIICDEDAVSFEQIRKILDASKGSISTNLKQLTHTRLIEPVSLPGDRKTYYRVNHMQINDIMRNRIETMRKFKASFLKGIDLKTREDDVSEWLYETACFYAWMELRIHEMVAQWEEEKKEIIEHQRSKR